METRILRLIYSKSGAGNITPKLTLPVKWTKELGLTTEEREVEVTYDGDKIIIKKAK